MTTHKTTYKFDSKRLLLMVAVSLLLSGCIQKELDQLHQPGEYIGKQDPLLATAGGQELTAQLQQRLQQVQTDR